MKRLILFLLLVSTSCFAQTQAGSNNGTATSTGVAGIIAALNGAYYYTATYVVTGSPASFSIQIETSANNGGSYSLCGSASTIQSTTMIACSGVSDHVRLNITALTAGGSVAWALQTWYSPFSTPVTLSGSPNVTVSNTPSVTISGTPNVSVSNFPSPTIADPCQDSTQDKSSAVVAIGAATTLEIISLTGGQRIYLCPSVVTSGAAGTFQLVTGTSTNCGTGQTNLTGAFTTITGTPLDLPSGIKVPTGQAVCGITTGLLSTANGVLVYVKK